MCFLAFIATSIFSEVHQENVVSRDIHHFFCSVSTHKCRSVFDDPPRSTGLGHFDAFMVQESRPVDADGHYRANSFNSTSPK